jgi:acyl carrier protein
MMPQNQTTGARPAATDVEAFLVELVAEMQERDEHEVTAAIEGTGSGIGLDSLDAVEILVSLEEHFGLRFPDDAVTTEALETVEGLARYVRRLVEDVAS